MFGHDFRRKKYVNKKYSFYNVVDRNQVGADSHEQINIFKSKFASKQVNITCNNKSTDLTGGLSEELYCYII